LTPDLANARQHNERNLQAICDSLSRFKQRKPIIVQREGLIVRAGNGTLMAAKRLGWTHIAAVVVDENNIDAAAFAIADNRTAELATWNKDALASTLDALSKESIDLGGLGWSPGEIKSLIPPLELPRTFESFEVPSTPEAPPSPAATTTPAPTATPSPAPSQGVRAHATPMQGAGSEAKPTGTHTCPTCGRPFEDDDA